MDVGIVGGSGYGGAELLRLLSTHPTLKVRTIAAGSRAGQDLADVFPSLGLSGELAESTPEAPQWLRSGLPGDTACGVTGPGADAAVDGGVWSWTCPARSVFRLARSSSGTRLDHTAPQLTPARVRTPRAEPCADRRGDAHRRSRLLSDCRPPGPGTPGGSGGAPESVTVVGMSGSSGAGRGLRDDLHVSHASGNTGAYGAPAAPPHPRRSSSTGQHRPHQAATLTFTPHLVPQVRGMVVTLDGDADRAPEHGPGRLRRGLRPRTLHHRACRRAGGRSPPTVLGANTCHIGVATDPRTGRVTVSAAIDNLTKGAAGQALQAANIALGLPETDGLPTMAVYP